MKRRTVNSRLSYSHAELRTIRALLEEDDEASAQRIIFDKLIRVFRGPRTRARIAPGDRRKRLVKA